MTGAVSLAGGQASVILPLAQVPYSIVGTGEITNSLCGQFSKLLVCQSNPGHQVTLPYVCHRWTCPVCFEKNVLRAAKRGTERLEAVESAYRGSGRALGSPVHVVFSVPEDLYSLDLPSLKAKCLTHAQKVGISAGSVIFHPYRVIKSYDYELKQYMKQLPKDQRKGVWSLIRADVLGLGSWTKYVYYSPHFHIIGYMPYVLERSNEFFERTGWVYKNITGSGKMKSLTGTLYYLLTHSFYSPGKQVLTYFGLASYNKIQVIVTVSKEDMLCPVCGGPMWLHHGWDHDGQGHITDIGEPLYLYEVKKRTVAYKLKPPKLKSKY